MDRSLERWTQQSPMTNPGNQAFLLRDLPADVGALCRVIQGLLIHLNCIPMYGLTGSKLSTASRDTLALSTRLERIVKDDPSALTVPRAPSGRAPATCRDYALMLCGMLRHQGTPARVRCGFASYLGPNVWEDHWVCEYWSSPDGAWLRADAQIDDVLRRYFGIDFDTNKLPPETFIPACDAWERCRNGRCVSDGFGNGSAHGLWYVRVNVIRDHYVLNQLETSEWDSWRLAGDTHQELTGVDMAETDRIARMPEQPLVDRLMPPWS